MELLEELKQLVHILVAVVLGFAIGYERKLRFKEAGIRTHTIVCAGAALMMVVSKHGFGGEEADASRVAAQIVAGIGFLGAGMIVYRKHEVHGLTTAAGVWATAGIGMAAGAGLYIIAAGATAIIIGVQCLFHLPCKIFRTRKYFQIKICFTGSGTEGGQSKRAVLHRSVQSAGHRAQGRRDGLSRHAQHGQRIFFGAASGDHGGKSLYPLDRALRRNLTESGTGGVFPAFFV